MAWLERIAGSWKCTSSLSHSLSRSKYCLTGDLSGLLFLLTKLCKKLRKIMQLFSNVSQEAGQLYNSYRELSTKIIRALERQTKQL